MNLPPIDDKLITTVARMLNTMKYPNMKWEDKPSNRRRISIQQHLKIEARVIIRLVMANMGLSNANTDWSQSNRRINSN